LLGGIYFIPRLHITTVATLIKLKRGHPGDFSVVFIPVFEETTAFALVLFIFVFCWFLGGDSRRLPRAFTLKTIYTELEAMRLLII